MSNTKPTEPDHAGIHLGPGAVRDLAALLTTLEEFLRYDSVGHHLAGFLAARSHAHPGNDAPDPIDVVSFAGHRFRA